MSHAREDMIGNNEMDIEELIQKNPRPKGHTEEIAK